jgi:hypothetical protein
VKNTWRMSALDRITDSRQPSRQVRKVPKRRHHSITSSAVASSVDGTVRPSALAVLRLMTNSNLVGCSIGRSVGLVPCRFAALSGEEVPA